MGIYRQKMAATSTPFLGPYAPEVASTPLTLEGGPIALGLRSSESGLRDTYASNYFADRNYANLDKSEYVDNLSGVADARSGDYLKSFYFQVFISMITYVDFNAV